MLTLNIVHNLGNLYSYQGKIKEAKNIYLWVLTGYKKTWGQEYSLMLNIANSLGLLYSGKDKIKEAIKIYL